MKSDTIINGKTIRLTDAERRAGEAFHKSRLAFAWINGRLVFNRKPNDDRDHQHWLLEDYDIAPEQWELLPRGYIIEGRIQLFVGSDFRPIDTSTVSRKDLSRLYAKHCSMYPSAKCNLYNGVQVGQIGKLWPPIEHISTLAHQLNNKYKKGGITMRASKLVNDWELRNIEVPMAFLFDHYLAAYISLKHDQVDNEVPSVIQELVDSGEFDKVAKTGMGVLQDYSYTDLDAAAASLYVMLRLKAPEAVYVQEFLGTISQLDPDGKPQTAVPTNQFSLLYIPETGKTSAQEFLSYIKNILQPIGFPDDLPWEEYVVAIKGRGCGM